MHRLDVNMFEESEGIRSAACWAGWRRTPTRFTLLVGGKVSNGG